MFDSRRRIQYDVSPSQCDDNVSHRSKACGNEEVAESRGCPLADPGGGGGRGAAVEGPACDEPVAAEGRLAC